MGDLLYMNNKANYTSLTKVCLVYNEDGVHRKEELIGYVIEEPFVVLTYFLCSHFVSTYKEELYPIGYTGFKHSLAIYDEGNYNLHRNFTKSAFANMHDFIRLNQDMIDLANTTNYSDAVTTEYLGYLALAKDRIPDIQQAIDWVEVLGLIDTDSVLKLLNEVFTVLNSIGVENVNKNLLTLIISVMKSASMNIEQKEDKPNGTTEYYRND